MKFTHSTEIQAPPQILWAIWSDIEHWPDWTASITQIQKLAPGPLAVGLRACVRQPKLPVAIWRVTELEPDCGFTWVTLTFAGPIALLFGWLSSANAALPPT